MLNKVLVQGRMVADPELRYTAAGQKAVLSFTIACEKDVRDENGKRGSDFFDVVAWEKNAEFISKYFKQGDWIVIVGRLQQRKWQDKNGNNRDNKEIVVQESYFCGNKKSDDRIDNPDERPSVKGDEPFMKIDDEDEFEAMFK